MEPRSVAAAAPPCYASRIALFYGGYFIFTGVALPFYPVWLEARGLTDTEIASCVALPMAVRVLLVPLAGLFADRAPNRRFVVRIFMVGALAAFLLAWPATSFGALLVTTGSAWILSQLSLPVGDALALTGVRQFRLDYGRMRFSGSVTFILTNLAAGAVVGAVSSEAIYWLMLAGLAAGAIVSLTLPVTPREVRALDDRGRPVTRPAREVLGNPALLLILAAGSLVQASHGVFYSFGSLYWQRRGFSGGEIGSLWAAGVLCEIALFLWSGAVVRRTGDVGILMIGTLAAVLRWSLFPLEMGFAGFLLIQCLHGLTFGATYLGVQHAIARIVPDEMTASAQGIYAMMTGVLMASIAALAGPLYGTLGAVAFATMVVPALVAVMLLVIYRRIAAAA